MMCCRILLEKESVPSELFGPATPPGASKNESPTVDSGLSVGQTIWLAKQAVQHWRSQRACEVSSQFLADVSHDFHQTSQKIIQGSK
jgi:hypothetical protein